MNSDTSHLGASREFSRESKEKKWLADAFGGSDHKTLADKLLILVNKYTNITYCEPSVDFTTITGFRKAPSISVFFEACRLLERNNYLINQLDQSMKTFWKG